MVRLESYEKPQDWTGKVEFTFQYGQIRKLMIQKKWSVVVQIYIPVWLDQKSKDSEDFKKKNDDLHSSMVRLEICLCSKSGVIPPKFTFQYGQIRNRKSKKEAKRVGMYLHSSMVRLEIFNPTY